jgi:hypothetical protein
VEAHNPDCANRPLTRPEIDRIFGQRKRRAALYTVKGRQVPDVPFVSAAHHLDVVLQDSELQKPVASLLEELAAVSDLCSAIRAAQTDQENRPTATVTLPNLTPAWAAKKRDQVARRISEEAEAVAAWVHKPQDPTIRLGHCVQCGGPLRREAAYCTDCGAPTLHKWKREA